MKRERLCLPAFFLSFFFFLFEVWVLVEGKRSRSHFPSAAPPRRPNPLCRQNERRAQHLHVAYHLTFFLFLYFDHKDELSSLVLSARKRFLSVLTRSTSCQPRSPNFER